MTDKLKPIKPKPEAPPPTEAEQIAQALRKDDVLTAARLLDDLGSCRWPSELPKIQQAYRKEDRLQKTSLAVQASIDGDKETITFHRYKDGVHDAWSASADNSYPMVSVTQPRCKDR